MSIAEALKTRWRLVAAVLVVALVLGLGIWWLNRPTRTEVLPTPTPTVSVASPSVLTSAPAVTSTAPPSPSATTAPPASISASPTVATTSAAAAAAGCDPTDSEGFVPNRFTIDSLGADERVLSLGLDGDGAIAAPPKDQPRTASWWNQGPRPGSDEGKVVLSIHTYRNGGALGNQLYEGGKPQLEPGEIIKLYGAKGQVACYEFVEATKVFVDDYDPDSTVMVDRNGDPLLTIVICWDFRKSDEFWQSRVFFYARPVTS